MWSDIAEFIADLIEVGSAELWIAWNRFLDRAIDFFNPWTHVTNILTGRVGETFVNLINAFDGLLADLGAILPRTLGRVLLDRLPAPPSAGWRVLTLKEAHQSFCEFLLIDGADAVSLRTPAALRLARMLTSRAGAFRVLLNSGLLSFLLHRVLEVLKFSILRIVILVIRVLTILFSALGALIILLMFHEYFDRAARGHWIFERKALSQDAPRKKVKIKGGGSIYRREPGGSKP